MNYKPKRIDEKRSCECSSSDKGEHPATVTLTFDYFEHHAEWNMALKASACFAALCEFDNRLRSAVKHSDDDVEASHAEKWRDSLWEVLSSYGVDPWEY